MLSHPAWGEWIEIQLLSFRRFAAESHPAWGEWIEIGCRRRPHGGRTSHPAWGERIEIAPGRAKTRRGIVPLRMDSRNTALLLHL